MNRKSQPELAAMGGLTVNDGGMMFGACAGNPTVEFIDIVFSQVKRDLQDYADRMRIEREISSYSKKRKRRCSA